MVRPNDYFRRCTPALSTRPPAGPSGGWCRASKLRPGCRPAPKPTRVYAHVARHVILSATPLGSLCPMHPHAPPNIRGRFRFPSQPLGRHPSGALISPAVSTVTASRLFFSLVFFFSSQVCCWRTPARTLFRTLDPSIPYVRFSVSPSPSLRLYLPPLYPISFSQALTTPSLWTSPSSTTWRCWWTTPRSRPARSSPPR